jgi:hypothetical protein
LEKLRYCLGLEIAGSEKETVLNQRKYTLKFFKDFDNLANEPSPITCETSLKLHSSDYAPYEDQTQFMRLIGNHLYITNGTTGYFL